MQNILKNRVFRDLKENLLRYLALGMLIILGMYIIISLVGAADTIIIGVDRKAEENRIEDGQFGVFIPLRDDEIEKLTEKGVSLEAMFYLDFENKESNLLRVFQNRENINLIDLDEGRLAEGNKEAVLEKRYCIEHHINVGDSVEIGGITFLVVGIGSVPDYDAPYKNLSDSSVDSGQFGLAFVTKEAYAHLKETNNSEKSEEYVYSYRLNGKMTDEELKKELKKLQFSPEKVQDSYFQEYWDETAGKKEELQDGIKELTDGSKKLQEALEELNGHNSDLKEGTESILDSYLDETYEGLSAYGLTQELTEENFENVLEILKENTENAVLRLKIQSILEQLKQVKSYKDGIFEYTEGVEKTEDGSKDLYDGMKELQEETDEMLDAYFDVDVSNLTQFLKAEDNPRIKASADDQVINKLAGLIAGVIIMVLFTYVISVFVIHGIEKESSVIGALYALGVKKKELMVHYLMLPVVVTFVAGVIGTLIGYSKFGIDVQMQDCYDYYSLPVLSTIYSPYLIVYGIVMPPVAAAIVNCLVIQKRLSKPVLALIRNEVKGNKFHNINLGNMGFIGRFRIRQMLREARTGITVLFGMFISMLILMLGIDVYVMCEHISTENKQDTKYEYMYTYKYPEKKVPEGGEACFAKTLKKEIFGYNMEVTILGINQDNPYFDAKVTKGKDKVIISSAMAQKYQLDIGEQLILSDEEKEMNYAFTVEEITQYSTGLYVFMDIDSMRELFGEGEDYYNVVLSDHELDIESGRLYATTSKEEISKSSDVFVALMMPMIYMMTIVAALIFGVVMYLMMKVMIDRSAFSISLIKVFGYRTGEIRKLYLNGNFYIIAVGAAICLPLSKKAIDAMYPLLVSNVACGMNLTFSWQLYLGIYGCILILYFIINQLLVKRLDKMVPAEVLKNRE